MEVKIDGLNQVLQNLNLLVVDEAMESKALNKAGKIAKEAIASQAPVGKGTLQRNIKLKRAKNGEALVHTGGAYHAHLVEFGRSGGSAITKKGRRVKWGPTSPNPFFTRGWDASETEAKQAMVDELRKGLGL